MSMQKKQRGGLGLNPWDDMSFEEQAKFIADYKKERSMRGQLEKRVANLETVVKKLETVVNKYKNIATGAVSNVRSKFSSFTRKKGGKYIRRKPRRTRKRKHKY